MSSFNFEDKPFRRIIEEIEQVQGSYYRIESMARGACELLGDCRPANLCKELKQLQKKHVAEVKENQAALVGMAAQ